RLWSARIIERVLNARGSHPPHPPETGAESMFKALSALCGALVVCHPRVARAAGIPRGYFEGRARRGFTGPRLSNAAGLIYGKQAVMAWKVTEGSYNGVDLAGLTVAAAVQATTTFSEDKPEAARSIVIVDAAANERQRDALVAMAKELAGKRLDNIVDVKT